MKNELPYYCHPSSIIDEGASIGDGTKIWHFNHIMGSAKIGTECILGQNVFIGNHVSIGNQVKVQNNVSIYEGVTCEDEVFLGPSMVFTNVINPRSYINRKSEFRKTLVKRGATIGANATILCGVTIGEYAFIGAGAVVTKDVPDHALFMGVPAVFSKWLSKEGHTLSFDKNGRFSENGITYILENKKVKRI